MDGNYVDLTALNNYKDEFTKESKQTASSTLNTVQDSYLAKSSDPYVGKMYTNIESEVQNIEKGSGNIITYWDSYTTDVQGVDKALASDNKDTTEINSPSVSTYVNQLPDLGTVDTPDTKFDPLQKAKDGFSQVLNTMGIGTTGGTTGVKKSDDGKTDSVKDTVSEAQNTGKDPQAALQELSMQPGNLADVQKYLSMLPSEMIAIGQKFSEFVMTSDENLPAVTEGLTELMKDGGILGIESAKAVNEAVAAYVGEGAKASIQGAATFAANFDWQGVETDYINATTTLAEETLKGSQAGLKTGFSNFDFGPIIASGVAGVGTMAAGIATNPTNLGSYLNPVVDVAAATLGQTIPAVSAGATAFARNFDTGKVVNGYVSATINAAAIAARAAQLGINDGLSAIDMERLQDSTKNALDKIGIACGEAYASFMDDFGQMIGSIDWQNMLPLPIPIPGGNGESGGSGGWTIPGIPGLELPDLSNVLPSFSTPDLPDINIPVIGDISLANLPGSGFDTVNDYLNAIKNQTKIENANFVTALPKFLIAQRNTTQMAMYAPQIAYDYGAQEFNNGFDKILDAKNHMMGRADTNPDDIKVITSIGDSCESGWGLDAYNERGEYIVANENVEGSAPMLVGQALGAEVHQLHMPGARTTEVLQVLNPLSSGLLNKSSIPFATDLLGLFSPTKSTSLTNTPAQVATPLLYGFGDHLTDPVMGAMTPQYTSAELVAQREKYYDSIRNSDVVVLDIGMNDYWVPLAGTFYEIARDGGAGTNNLMADMDKDPLGWMAQFMGNYVGAWATHPDKWPLYCLMIGEGAYKWAADYFVNYALIAGTIYMINPNAELVLVGGYNPVDDWDLIPGMDDNTGQYLMQVAQNFHDWEKRAICLLYPGKSTYVDMRGVEIQSDETTFLLPSLDDKGYNPHPTEKGAYMQADRILTQLNAESPYKEQIKGEKGYYNGSQDFYKLDNIKLFRNVIKGTPVVKDVVNAGLSVVPESQKDITNALNI